MNGMARTGRLIGAWRIVDNHKWLLYSFMARLIPSDAIAIFTHDDGLGFSGAIGVEKIGVVPSGSPGTGYRLIGGR
ncbi:hypothetical protein FXO37_32082 [Capsicum annuum]|nr:hypothetical protein FXO37_32082 [Capsicum annuum]